MNAEISNIFIVHIVTIGIMNQLEFVIVCKRLEAKLWFVNNSNQ